MYELPIVSALWFAAAQHPFITYPLSLRVLAGGQTLPFRSGTPPQRVAVCVCAYNEERVIAERVENLLAQRRDFPDLDILFYVDAASDRTADILRGYGDAIRLVVSESRHGKTHGMNTLIDMTDAEVVVFSDANVQFAPDAIARLIAPFADPDIGCVCGHLLYTKPGAPPGTSTAVTGSLYWRLEEHIKALETETGSVMGADGSIFALRRALHEPPPSDLIDDMYVSFAALCRGARIVRVADAIAYEESVSRPAEEFRRKIRIACQAFNVNRALWPRLLRLSWLDRYKYLSHKLLRWLAIYSFSLGCTFAMAQLSLSADPAIAGSVLFGAIALAFIIYLSRRGPIAKIRDVFSALIATGIGVFKSLQGERFQTWNPPASAREGVSGSTSKSHTAPPSALAA